MLAVSTVSSDPLISEALQFTRSYLGASAALFYWVDPRRGEMQVCETQGVPSGLLEQYGRGMGAYDPMRVSRMLATGERIGVLSNEVPTQLDNNTALYRQYLRAFGVRDTVDLMLWGEGHAYGGMGILKTFDDSSQPTGAEALLRLQSFLQTSFARHPYVCQFQLNQRLSQQGLSHRERQVTRLVCTGASNSDIADAMGVTLGTVKTYLVRIFEKLEVDSRTALVAYAGKLSLQSVI